MERYKKIIKIKFVDTTFGNFANSLSEAYTIPFLYFFKGLGWGILGAILILIYPLWFILVLGEYYTQREIYWVKIKKSHKRKENGKC